MATLTQTDGFRLSWDSVSGGNWKSAGSVVFLLVALRADLLLVVAACQNGHGATPLSDTSCLMPLPPEAKAHSGRAEVRVEVDVLLEVDLEGLLGLPLPRLLVGQVIHCGHKGAALPTPISQPVAGDKSNRFYNDERETESAHLIQLVV